MAVKNISTRAQICGRSAKCHGGHSAIEQASYISRTAMYCEYDGKTYYPKYSEDLVHTEVMLPANAPKEYLDPSVLWNSVEKVEKGANAQLARTYRVELPNEWSYELATEVMKDYIKRNFVDEGMCAHFAIHESENKKTGQRNLHCHILLTLRSIDEKGEWMAKQKKVYLKDENGEKIPLIDRKTGEQKVDKQNRKQWKCETVSTNSWSNRENAKKWRKDLANTVNAVNEKLNMTDNFWEHRSFAEQGLDITPQIHLGEKASAMERAGIHSVRGNINRDIVRHNAVIEQARATFQSAKSTLEYVKKLPVKLAKNVKNEIVDMVREVVKRNNRLFLPIVNRKYVGLITNRAMLQRQDIVEAFIEKEKLSTFADLKEYKAKREPVLENIRYDSMELSKSLERLETLMRAYEDYQPYIKPHKESEELIGIKKIMFDKKHAPELECYDIYREKLVALLKPNEKITPAKWRDKIKEYSEQMENTKDTYGKVVSELATVELLEHNKKELNRMLEYERKAQEREQTRQKAKNNQSIE
jgi:hypothetical protein